MVMLIILGMTASHIAMVLSVAKQSSLENARDLFSLAAAAAYDRTVSFLQPAKDLALLGASLRQAQEPIVESGLDHPLGDLFTGMLMNKRSLYSVYIGQSDGSFFQIIKARENPKAVLAHEAPENTDTILRTITGSGKERVQSFTFLGADGSFLGERKGRDFSFDPRTRSWYQNGLNYHEITLSEPYVFNSLQEPGLTVAQRFADQSGVVGVDITLSLLEAFTVEQRISENGGLALLTENGDIIAATPRIRPFLESLSSETASFTEFFRDTGIKTIGEMLVRSERSPVAVNRNLYIIAAAPQGDFLGGAVEMKRKIIIFSGFILVIIIPLVFFWAKSLSRALKDLTADAERVSKMDFDGTLRINTPIYEFDQLSLGFQVMKKTIADRTKRLQETLIKLETLVDAGISMSAELDINRLSEKILAGAKKLTHADGGSLYLVNEERTQLEFQIVLNDSLGFKQGGTSGVPVGMVPVPLYNQDGSENHHNVVTHTFHTERTVNIKDAYDGEHFDFTGTRIFDQANNYKSTSFLTVPLKPRGGGDIMGALQLINARNPVTGEIVPFPGEWHGFLEALSAAAAVAVQNWKLMERQKQLFNDLVRFVASAIDAKSHYTAKHCERVPEIARLLCQEAIDHTTGPFAHFTLNPEEKREFEISAWLHDCGKVTTPEYVVDKATKLETIYNRLHEIRTRFEVLLRDARIEYLEAVMEGKDPRGADQDLRKKENKLQEDYAFVAECNLGSEFMEDRTIERLREIASVTWYRHFDRHLGLSWGELSRLPSPADGERESLPVREFLLQDGPEHIIPRDVWTQETYKKYGMTLEIPFHLYNRGELHNLSVRKGTLTEEERFKVEDHVAQTIVMLEHLSFPKDLKRVPRYAGNHHEALNGLGYPRGLKASELSIPERIIAIADIFEALTSMDRPYKRPNTLSMAVEILHDMKVKGYIDPDLFDVLLTSGVYKQYAQEFLSPDQIDQVDIQKYL